ncbi:MAG TPA: hypothetical protein VIJ19_09795, partial [Opitutaceae bacterium]
TMRHALAPLLVLALAIPAAHAFLGVADTSFVTVIANPAEAANWAAELARLNSQLAAATSTLEVAGEIRTFAGDPRAAVAALADLGPVNSGVSGLASGPQTGADLAQAWQSLGPTGQLSGEAALLASSGPGSSMAVFGQELPRDPSIYASLAADSASARSARGQVAREQAVRSLIAEALTDAWTRFRSATTESAKQALLTQISQLQSQDQVMSAHRRALLDDLELADRQGRAASLVRAKASDEQGLAESSLLKADLQGRVQAAEALRLATLQKAPGAPADADYSGLRVWTTADAGGTSE